MLRRKRMVKITNRNAQAAIEYMLLLASVVAIVVISLRPSLTRVEGAGNVYYNRTVRGILGPAATELQGVHDF